MFDRGWDLAELWRKRRWRLLLNVIDHLPSTSHFIAAVADDDELAENSPPPRSGPPALRDWTPEVQYLVALYDRLGELIATVASANSTKRVKPPKPYPRPVTAYDRVRGRRRWKQHQWLVEQLKPRPGVPTMADSHGDDPRFTAHRVRRD